MPQAAFLCLFCQKHLNFNYGDLYSRQLCQGITNKAPIYHLRAAIAGLPSLDLKVVVFFQLVAGSLEPGVHLLAIKLKHFHIISQMLLSPISFWHSQYLAIFSSSSVKFCLPFLR